MAVQCSSSFLVIVGHRGAECWSRWAIILRPNKQKVEFIESGHRPDRYLFGSDELGRDTLKPAHVRTARSRCRSASW